MGDEALERLAAVGTPKQVCRILSLDGGGAKGFYTLGVLHEVEAVAKRPLCEVFDLIFGTSTGSIIAAQLALGKSVDDIHTLYRKYVPTVMQRKSAEAKSEALEELSGEVFGDQMFDAFRTGIGIVATRWELERPMIFKADIRQAHGRRETFVPGFGCKVGDAVQASCSAYPFFLKKTVTTDEGNQVELIDGGYCANNPTLYAIADAVAALKMDLSDLRVLSVGVGNYPQPKPSLMMWFAKKYLVSVELLQKTLEVNTNSMEQLRQVLYRDVRAVRISDTFDKPELATDMFEHNLKKLNQLYQQGGESYARREADVKALLF